MGVRSRAGQLPLPHSDLLSGVGGRRGRGRGSTPTGRTSTFRTSCRCFRHTRRVDPSSGSLGTPRTFTVGVSLVPPFFPVCEYQPVWTQGRSWNGEGPRHRNLVSRLKGLGVERGDVLLMYCRECRPHHWETTGPGGVGRRRETPGPSGPRPGLVLVLVWKRPETEDKTGVVRRGTGLTGGPTGVVDLVDGRVRRTVVLHDRGQGPSGDPIHPHPHRPPTRPPTRVCTPHQDPPNPEPLGGLCASVTSL